MRLFRHPMFDYKYWIATLLGFLSAMIMALIVELPYLLGKVRPSPAYWVFVVAVFFGTGFLVSKWIYRRLRPPESK